MWWLMDKDQTILLENTVWLASRDQEKLWGRQISINVCSISLCLQFRDRNKDKNLRCVCLSVWELDSIWKEMVVNDVWHKVHSWDELNLGVCVSVCVRKRDRERKKQSPVPLMSHHIISYQALRCVGNLRFLLYVPLNFHTPVNADGSTNHFTTHTHT